MPCALSKPYLSNGFRSRVDRRVGLLAEVCIVEEEDLMVDEDTEVEGFVGVEEFRL